MIDERGVIGTRSERAYPHICALTRVLAVFRVSRPRDRLKMGTLECGQFRLRILNVAGNTVHKVLQRVPAVPSEISASVAVAVDVCNRVFREILFVSFGPFRGTEQHGFFAIPRTVNNGALRPPPLLHEFSEGACLFEQCDLAGRWILGAVDPRVVMI